MKIIPATAELSEQELSIILAARDICERISNETENFDEFVDLNKSAYDAVYDLGEVLRYIDNEWEEDE